MLAVLFLDPMLLGLLAVLVVVSWTAWTGAVSGWFGRPARWTVLVWPGPLVAILGPFVAGTGLALLRLVGIEVGGMLGAVVYAVLSSLPAIAVLVVPPRIVLPRWARARLVVPPGPRMSAVAGRGTARRRSAGRGRRGRAPVDGGTAPAGLAHGADPNDTTVARGAMGAVQVSTPGHGSLARWRWRVDGVAGWLSFDAGVLRFRAVEGAGGPDDDALAELRLSTDGELRLEPPRGGLLGVGYLDVVLAEVDDVRVRAVRPWRRDGAVTIEVAGRAPVHLWVTDVRRVRGWLSTSAARTTSIADGAGS